MTLEITALCVGLFIALLAGCRTMALSKTTSETAANITITYGIDINLLAVTQAVLLYAAAVPMLYIAAQ